MREIAFGAAFRPLDHLRMPGHCPALIGDAGMGLTLEERKALKGSGGLRPRAMPVGDALEYSGLSRSTFYRFAAQGRIELVKVGRSTLALTDSLDALIDSLSRAVIRAPRERQFDAP
jgi:hypothetical protein